MFDISTLQYNSENPTLVAIAFTVVSSLILGILLVFTYDRTTKEMEKSWHFMQALILITIVAATIMQAIGDSVARGLGMLGALSIIRFRTTVTDPRNIVFMFAAIAAGIACGVFGFVIAFVGTLTFCATAFFLNLASFNKSTIYLGRLKIETIPTFEAQDLFNQTLNRHCVDTKLVKGSVQTSETKLYISRSEYEVLFRDKSQMDKLLIDLRNIEGLTVRSINCESTKPRI